MKASSSEPHPDLRRGQPGAAGVPQRLGKVLDQLAQRAVEVGHRFGLGEQDRVAEQPDRSDGHGPRLPSRLARPGAQSGAQSGDTRTARAHGGASGAASPSSPTTTRMPFGATAGHGVYPS